MDERLEKALAFANYRTTIESQRRAIKRRFEAMTVTHHENGVFVADAATMSFVAALIADGHKDAILLDTKENPIDVPDLKAFYELLSNRYFEAANEYSTEIKKLAKARNIKKVMDW